MQHAESNYLLLFSLCAAYGYCLQEEDYGNGSSDSTAIASAANSTRPGCAGKPFTVNFHHLVSVVTETQKAKLNLCLQPGIDAKSLAHNVALYEKVFVEFARALFETNLDPYRIHPPRNDLATVTTQRMLPNGPGYEYKLDVVWFIKDNIWQPFETDAEGDPQLMDINGDKITDIVILAATPDGDEVRMFLGQSSGGFVAVDPRPTQGSTKIAGKGSCENFLIECNGGPTPDGAPATPTILGFDCRNNQLIEKSEGSCSHVPH